MSSRSRSWTRLLTAVLAVWLVGSVAVTAPAAAEQAANRLPAALGSGTSVAALYAAAERGDISSDQQCWMCGYYSCYITGDNSGAAYCSANGYGTCTFANICSGGYPIVRGVFEVLGADGLPIILAAGRDDAVDCKGRRLKVSESMDQMPDYLALKQGLVLQ